MVFHHNWCDDFFPFLPLSFQRAFLRYSPDHWQERRLGSATPSLNPIEIPDCHVARLGKRSFDFEQLITTKQWQQTNRLQNGPTLRTTQTLMPLWISLFQILCCLLWETWKKWSPTRFLFMAASQAFGISPWWNTPRVYNCWTPNKYSKPPWISWGPSIRLVIRKLPKEAGS